MKKRITNGLPAVTKTAIKELSSRLNFIQSVPESARLNNNERTLIAQLLLGPVRTRKWYDKLKPNIKDTTRRTIIKGLNQIAGEDRDRLIEVVENALPFDTKKTIWDYNHAAILKGIDELTKETIRFPSTTELQERTGLSRTTIARHLREYKTSPQFHQQQENLTLMRENILARVYVLASKGDTKAMKVFLEATGAQSGRVRNQTNYIQYNSLRITEEDLKRLPDEKLEKLLMILK